MPVSRTRARRVAAAAVSATLLASIASAGDLAPGSLLVFPLVDSRPGAVTILTVTNSNEAPGNTIDLEFRYRHGDDCFEFDASESLGTADTLTLTSSYHVPTPMHGFAHVYAVDRSAALPRAIVQNDLIGASSVIDAVGLTHVSVNPLPFLGLGNGFLTDLNANGHLELDGVEYEATPDRLVIPRFFGQDSNIDAASDLILINLTNTAGATAVTDVLLFNDNEQAFSTQLQFNCWTRRNLETISAAFSDDFLVSSNHAVFEPVGWLSQETGWMLVDGNFAFDANGSVPDPALLGFLVESLGTEADGSRPFHLDSQVNGGLIGPEPCSSADSAEPNDDCSTAFALPGANNVQLTALRVLDAGIDGSAADGGDDWYAVSLGPNEELVATVDFPTAGANIDLELSLACGGIVASSTATSGTTEQVGFLNQTNTTVALELRVFVASPTIGACALYDLGVIKIPDPCTIDDTFEPGGNNCGSAINRPNNSTTTGLRILAGNMDWWSVMVPTGRTQRIDLVASAAEADLFMIVQNSCSGSQVNIDFPGDGESYTFTNDNSGPGSANYRIGVGISANSTGLCADYTLVLDLFNPGTNLSSYCFGDGSGTLCPCGNHSSDGHEGGCAHQDGQGAVLLATGSPSLSADSVHLELTGAARNGFAVLVSGLNRLPQSGCIGCGLQAFDGLRCAGGDLRRHGSRATNSSGEANAGWGPPAGPAGGLGLASGAVVGQTRHYFSYFRTDLTETCFSGQNSSNAVSVTWTP